MAFESSLNVTLANAVSYLTRPLAVSHPATTIIKLQLILEQNLLSLFAPTWCPHEPLRGTGHRCLTLSPKRLPPHVIYSACLASGVQWFDWIALLGGQEFDFFVDPGCVSVRFGKKGNPAAPLITVWSDERVIPSPEAQGNAHAVSKKTLAQQLAEEDKQEDEELFAMLADEISSPSWISPIPGPFPVPAPSSSSPMSAFSAHSRSSSRSSNSSSGFSFGSSDSCGSATTISTLSSSPTSKLEHPQSKQIRRERARHTRVFVDITKTEVTPYDGGKTTVLTGGVMLGGPKKDVKSANPTNYRSVRV